MFGQELWVGFEAKSECKPTGEVSADAAREAGGHINYAAAAVGTAAPPGSFAVIMSARRVYLASSEVISAIASRLADAWDSIRIQTRTLGPTGTESGGTQVLHARRALPSQWLSSLTMRRVADDDGLPPGETASRKAAPRPAARVGAGHLLGVSPEPVLRRSAVTWLTRWSSRMRVLLRRSCPGRSRSRRARLCRASSPAPQRDEPGEAGAANQRPMRIGRVTWTAGT